VLAAAADAERFCQDPGRPRGELLPAAGQQEEEEGLAPLAISADGKGVAMRPEARRRRPGPRSRSWGRIPAAPGTGPGR
jgi:hypothetical protein